MSAFLYILHCADGSYYVGTARDAWSGASPYIRRASSMVTRRADGR